MSSAPKNSKPLHRLRINSLTIVLSVVLSCGVLQAYPIQPIPVWAIDANLSATAVDSHNFVTTAVERVEDAVVRIDTERTIINPFADLLWESPWLRDLLGEDVFKQLPREYLQKGQGSGLIIDRQGIILTNAHVVSEADTVKVGLRDGRTFKGEVRGIDRLSDLAVIKVDGENLPTAKLGNSSDLKVGDWAIAVGNPLGLDSTVTLGIISTLERSSARVGISDLRLNFIQTDAAINPGNSGGPLLNARGEVIGINTAIRAGAEGIGFAIPIDSAKAIKDRLIRGEKILHPYIGVQMLTLTPDVARQLNRDPNANTSIPEIEGALVISIMPNSPAEAAGLRRGDVITAIDDVAITDADQLQDIIDRSQIDRPLTLDIYRGENTKQLSVTPQAIESLTTNY